MSVNIYLTEVEGGGDFAFPSLPEEVKVTYATKYQSYSIISLGDVKIPRGTEVDTITWNGTFYGKSRKNLKFLKKWVSPKTCISTLKQWRNKGTVLRLLITGSPVNLDVTIAKIDYKLTGGLGDITYTITFNAYKELKIYTTAEREITAYEKKTTTRVTPEKETSNSNYTIKYGDNLWTLAREKLGDGTRWKEIYDANKDVIEKTARQYGHSSAITTTGVWIFPGEEIVIPSQRTG